MRKFFMYKMTPVLWSAVLILLSVYCFCDAEVAGIIAIPVGAAALLLSVILFITRQKSKTSDTNYRPLPDTPEEKANVLTRSGILQYTKHEYEQAVSSYEDALKIWRTLAIEDPQTYLPDVAVTLNNLGTLQRDMSDFRQALASYEEALMIRRGLAANDRQAYLPDVAAALNNLGVLQRTMQDYPEAVATYEEALEIWRALAVDNPQEYQPYVAVTLNNLGVLRSAMHDHLQAAAFYEEALEIRRALAVDNPQTYLPYVATTLANLALFYQEEAPDRERSVRYAKETLSYRASLEYISDANRAMEHAEEVLNRWERTE
jgi:tetratricopeptide (TPR) repeat protein